MHQNKLKILIVHNYYQIPGGEDTVVKNEKKLLEEHGHKVILYTRNNSELKEMTIAKKLLLPFITIFNPRTYREVKKIIKKENIDIVHVHNTLNLISPSVFYAAFSCKIPVVQTLHNFRLLCPGATFYRDGHICEDCVRHTLLCAIRHACYRNNRLETMACVISTKFHRLIGTYHKINYICLTEFNKEKLLQLNKPKQKQIINPDSIYIKPNFTFDDPLPESKNVTRDYFIYVGRLEEIKGIKVLYKAWNQMGRTAPHLIVCGTGTLEEWCKECIRQHLVYNIEMKGFVKHKEVIRLMAGAKALIMPTQWYEGFGMTILESYSVGTPVIGSDIGNVGELIKKIGIGYTFKHDSPDDLILKLRQNCLSEKVNMPFQYTAEGNYSILNGVYKEISCHDE